MTDGVSTCPYRRPRGGIGVALALGIAASAAVPASAEDRTATVLGLEANNAPDDIVNQMTLALRLALAEAPGYQAVPGRDLIEMRLVFCAEAMDAECMSRAATSLGAEQILFGVVTGQPQGHTVSMTLVDAGTKSVKATAEAALPLAVTPQDVQTAASTLLARLVGLPIPSLLRVISEPAGARLSIDGVDIGHVGESGRTVPDVEPGPRNIRLTLDGYVPYDSTVEIKSGEPNELRVQLAPEGAIEFVQAGPPSAEPAGTRRVWRIVSWVSVGVAAVAGTAAIVTGIKTRSIEDEKDDAIRAWNADHPAPEWVRVSAGPSGDACAEAERDGVASEVISACDRGRRMALVTNVLLGTAGVAAVVWGVSFHRGYLSVEPSPSGAVVLARTAFW